LGSELGHNVAVTHKTELYPAIEPYQTGRLQVSTLHNLYWEQCGNPYGVPVLFLHGGPGGGCSIRHRRFFDPDFYRAVLFDQRGAGRSTPLGEFHDNTTQRLVSDIETLREHLGIDRWLVFGGSWGSTLALAYGQAHPQRCLGFILRGIFLCRKAEVQWFIDGIRHVFPEAWRKFSSRLMPNVCLTPTRGYTYPMPGLGVIMKACALTYCLRRRPHRQRTWSPTR
jgi:proline iminopeptidase